MKHIIRLFSSIVGAVAPFITYAQMPYYGPMPTPPSQQYNQYGGLGYNNPFGGYGGSSGGYATRAASITSIDQFITLAQTLLGYAQVLIFLLAIAYFLYAAFLFVKGDFGTGRTTLMWAVIGVIIGLFIFTIIPFLCWMFKATGGRACTL